MMNDKTQAEFDRITAMEPEQIAKDKYAHAFLQARRTYLRPEQKEVFKDLLEKGVVDGKPLKDLSKEDKAEFVKENTKAIAKAKKEAKEKAEQEKTVKESQNPEKKK